MRFLRQATTITVDLGPALDSTDGITEETALSPTVYVAKGGAVQAARNSATAITHDARGYYRVELNTTDTNTLGMLRVLFHAAGALPVWEEFSVLTAQVWDSLFGTDLLDVSVTQFGGSAGTFASGRPEVNTSHAAGTAWGSGAITAASIASDAITAAKIADGAIDAATFAAGAINAAAIATDAITSAKIAADAIGASELAADAITEIQSGLATAAALTTVDDFLDTEIAGLVTDMATVLARLTATRVGYLDKLNITGNVANQGSVDTIDDFLDTEIASIISSIAALNNISGSDVLSQVNTALNTAISELGVAAPSATPTMRTGLMLLYMALRNRSTTTATVQTIQNDAGATIASGAVSDDGTTFTKGEFA